VTRRSAGLPRRLGSVHEGLELHEQNLISFNTTRGRGRLACELLHLCIANFAFINMAFETLRASNAPPSA